MTPEEIASWIESACPHTCDFRGECWQCFTEAIDSATKALREENERLKAGVHDLNQRWTKAESANKALVEALRAFEAFYPRCAQLLDGWHADGTAWTEWDERVRRELTGLGRQVSAALAAHEEHSK